MRELFFLTIANILPRSQFSDNLRCFFLRLAGIKINGNCTVWGPLTIRPIGGAKNIEIGSGVFINTDVRFGVPTEKVIIGNNVLVGPRVMFETVNHSLKYQREEGRKSFSKSIIIEDEVWIGAGVIIVPGVTIGRGSVVAAGAVVTRNVEPNTLAGGVPAKPLRKLDDSC